MSIRRNTTNRLTLFRECYVCGQTMVITADTPFMRQLKNVDGKKQKTVYFCSESCKNSTYKHLFDGLAWLRKKEHDANRDIKEKNYKYYHDHEEKLRERRKQQYYAMTHEERDKLNEFRRKKRNVNKEEDNRKQREYRSRKKGELL